MDKSRDWNAIAIKINQLTQKGKLHWTPEPTNVHHFADSDRRVEIYYLARYSDRRLRLYKESYKDFDDEDRYTWGERVCLEFVDDDNRALWRFPRSRALWDLLETVQYQTADVDTAIDELLSGEWESKESE